MKDRPRIRLFRLLASPLSHLSRSALGLCGVVLVTTAAILWLFSLPTYFSGFVHNPYAGILLFLIVPAAFFLGLVLIPLGVYVRVRRQRKAGQQTEQPLPLTWSSPDLRRVASFVGVTTLFNLIIGTQFTYRAVNYMDTVAFCGTTCHRIMNPEYTAYRGSPHSRVDCVQCHIGPGASWFVRSKFSGVQQVFNYAFNTYPRPIPVPVHNLRPARETCEACHWPEKFDGDALRVITKVNEDEQNTVTKTVLLMHVGGGNGNLGIHGRHLGRGVQVEYAYVDPGRQTIPWIQYRDESGKVTLFRSADAKPGAEAGMEHRVMDCIDCHNRPAHKFDLPDRALDASISAGEIPRSLPFVRKMGLEILKRSYQTKDDARNSIPAALLSFYRQKYPTVVAQSHAEIDRAGAAVFSIYDRNVYPEMRIRWGTYPYDLGHVDFPGCFRCHDGSHAAADNKVITQDCNACHQLLAAEETSPEILRTLGVEAR